jgi:ATP dependent DNA ligase C terminal region
VIDGEVVAFDGSQTSFANSHSAAATTSRSSTTCSTSSGSTATTSASFRCAHASACSEERCNSTGTSAGRRTATVTESNTSKRTEPRGSRVEFGALLLGYHDDGRFEYAGKVGTGFDTDTLHELAEHMRKLERQHDDKAASEVVREG